MFSFLFYGKGMESCTEPVEEILVDNVEPVQTIQSESHEVRPDFLTWLRYVSCIVDDDVESPRLVAPSQAVLREIEDQARRTASPEWSALHDLLTATEREWKSSVQGGEIADRYIKIRGILWKLVLGSGLLRHQTDLLTRRYGLEVKQCDTKVLGIWSFSCLPGGKPFPFVVESKRGTGEFMISKVKGCKGEGRASMDKRCEGITDQFVEERLQAADCQLSGYLIISWIQWLQEKFKSQKSSSFWKTLCAVTILHLKYFKDRSNADITRYKEALKLWNETFGKEQKANANVAVSLLKSRYEEWKKNIDQESSSKFGLPHWEDLVSSTIRYIQESCTYNAALMESAIETFAGIKVDWNRGFPTTTTCRNMSLQDVVNGTVFRWSSYEMHFVCMVGSAVGAWSNVVGDFDELDSLERRTFRSCITSSASKSKDRKRRSNMPIFQNIGREERLAIEHMVEEAKKNKQREVNIPKKKAKIYAESEASIRIGKKGEPSTSMEVIPEEEHEAESSHLLRNVSKMCGIIDEPSPIRGGEELLHLNQLCEDDDGYYDDPELHQLSQETESATEPIDDEGSPTEEDSPKFTDLKSMDPKYYHLLPGIVEEKRMERENLEKVKKRLFIEEEEEGSSSHGEGDAGPSSETQRKRLFSEVDENESSSEEEAHAGPSMETQGQRLFSDDEEEEDESSSEKEANVGPNLETQGQRLSSEEEEEGTSSEEEANTGPSSETQRQRPYSEEGTLESSPQRGTHTGPSSMRDPMVLFGGGIQSTPKSSPWKHAIFLDTPECLRQVTRDIERGSNLETPKIKELLPAKKTMSREVNKVKTNEGESHDSKSDSETTVTITELDSKGGEIEDLLENLPDGSQERVGSFLEDAVHQLQSAEEANKYKQELLEERKRSECLVREISSLESQLREKDSTSPEVTENQMLAHKVEELKEKIETQNIRLAANEMQDAVQKETIHDLERRTSELTKRLEGVRGDKSDEWKKKYDHLESLYRSAEQQVQHMQGQLDSSQHNALVESNQILLREKDKLLTLVRKGEEKQKEWQEKREDQIERMENMTAQLVQQNRQGEQEREELQRKLTEKEQRVQELLAGGSPSVQTRQSKMVTHLTMKNDALQKQCSSLLSLSEKLEKTLNQYDDKLKEGSDLKCQLEHLQQINHSLQQESRLFQLQAASTSESANQIREEKQLLEEKLIQKAQENLQLQNKLSQAHELERQEATKTRQLQLLAEEKHLLAEHLHDKNEENHQLEIKLSQAQEREKKEASQRKQFQLKAAGSSASAIKVMEEKHLLEEQLVQKDEENFQLQSKLSKAKERERKEAAQIKILQHKAATSSESLYKITEEKHLLEEQLSQKEKEGHRIKEQHESIHSEQMKEIQEKMQKIKTLQEELAKAAEGNKTMQLTTRQLKEAQKNLEQQLQKREDEIKRIKQEAFKDGTDYGIKISELEQVLQDNKELKCRLSEATEGNDHLKGELQRQTCKLKSLQQIQDKLENLKAQEQEHLGQIHSLESENASLQKQLNSVHNTDGNEHAEEEIQYLRGCLDRAVQKSSRVHQEMVDSMKKEISRINAAYERTKSPPADYGQDKDPILNAVKRQLDRLSNHISSKLNDPSYFDVWKHEMEKLRRDILHDLKKSLDESERLKVQKDELDQKRISILGLKQELEEVMNEKNTLDEKLTECKISVEDRNELIRDLETKVRRLDKANELLSEENDAVRETMDKNTKDFEHHVASLEEKLTSQQLRERFKTRELEDAQVAHRKANEDIQVLTEKLEKKDRLMQREQQRNKQLEEVITHLQNFSGGIHASWRWKGKLLLLLM